MEFEVTNQDNYWSKETKNDHSYFVSNRLLADCIGIGSWNIVLGNRVEGFNSNKSNGYALLSYFVSQALEFRRLPFYEDRLYSKYIDKNDRRASETIFRISPTEVNEIVIEVKELYKHTQKKLKDANLPTVKLRREIHKGGIDDDYVEHLIMLIECAKFLGKENIEFEMDMLNSFGDQSAYKLHSAITIEHEFSACDILYCSNLINSETNDKLVETGEWVVINKSLTGLVKLPINSIKYDINNWRNKNRITTESAKSYLSKHIPFEYRNICFFEKHHGKQGISMTIRKKISTWLMLNNSIF